jgi:hypothetical protein
MFTLIPWLIPRFQAIIFSNIHGKAASKVIREEHEDQDDGWMDGWVNHLGLVFRFTIIWESIIVIIGEKRAEVTEIIWELIRPKVV